jgi:hypothetical protein
VAVCNKWKINAEMTKEIERSLQFWITHLNNTYAPPYAHVVDQEIREALHKQAKIGWGNFLKGFIAIKLLNMANSLPLNAFEQIRWTCEIIKPLWHSEHDHWTNRNKDRPGHTPEEEANIKREGVLQQARGLFLLKSQIDPKYQSKIFPPWYRISSKRTNNLEHWIETTQQTVHYLLNVNKQADNDPLPENEVNNPVPPLIDLARFGASASGTSAISSNTTPRVKITDLK